VYSFGVPKKVSKHFKLVKAAADLLRTHAKANGRTETKTVEMAVIRFCQ
jgi:hypothetical protein